MALRILGVALTVGEKGVALIVGENLSLKLPLCTRLATITFISRIEAETSRFFTNPEIKFAPIIKNMPLLSNLGMGSFHSLKIFFSSFKICILSLDIATRN